MVIYYRIESKKEVKTRSVLWSGSYGVPIFSPQATGSLIRGYD